MTKTHNTITIRSAKTEDSAGIAKVHIDTWHTTYKTIVPNELLNHLSYKQSEDRFKNKIENAADSYFILVAENEDKQIVGFCDGEPERSEHYHGYGEINAIYILRKYQGLGIGRRLIVEAVKRLRQLELEKLIIWVLNDNIESRKFYENLGGKATENKVKNFYGTDLDLVGYTWENLDSINSKISK